MERQTENKPNIANEKRTRKTVSPEVKAEKKRRAKKRFRVFVSNFFLVMFLLIVIAVGAVVGILGGIVFGCVITTKPLTLNEIYSTDRQTVIYDSEGNLMTTLKSKKIENTIWAGIDEIPMNLRNAFVAIEDERFYTHNGVDFKRSASAVLGFFSTSSGSHGGSTITQQLIKNVTGDDAHSVPRKIREQWRAIQLENTIKDKDRILELYLNQIYFANNCYGVQIAANKYFGCSVSDLNLAQCAYLAGIPNNPNKFNPATTTGRQNEYKRQVIILDKMLELGFITEDEYIEAIQTELTFKIDDATPEKTKDTHIYTYFEDMVIKDVREALVGIGYTTENANDLIFNGGLTIYTTQDTRVQKILDEIFTNEANFRMNVGRDPEDCSQCAIAIMNHETGEIVAVYGGYGKKTQSLTLNRATDIARQPGSTIKPLLVYGPLIDKGILTAGTALDELPEHLDVSNSERVWPSNWDDKVHGMLNCRYALLMSYNIPAAHFFVRNMPLCLEYLKKEGIDKFDEPYASTALGGFKKGVSPLEMAAGYSVIANGGIYYEPVSFSKVYTSDGVLLLDNTTRSGTVVYENPETAVVVTSMLESVAYDPRSTGRFAGITYGDVRLPLGGKTGSTTDLVDYWFAGFTSYYTAACWYGYDDSSPCDVNIEGGWATTIWHLVMTEIHKDLPIVDLRRSDNLVKVEICTSSGKRATEACKKDPRAKSWVYEEIYIKGTEPGPLDYCDCHQALDVCLESKDEYGKYCLATEWCELLSGNIRTAYGLHRDDGTVEYILKTIDENNDENGEGGEVYLPTDWSYELSHEYCKVCYEKAKELGLVQEFESPSPSFYVDYYQYAHVHNDGEEVPTETIIP
ncbi:MAG: transglycosylase domain-containing protein [Clostridia bacterium]|nr:transglycosylase domain-containing protein [Clostridia bacterium]